MRDPVTGDKELARALRQLAKGPSAREVDSMVTRAATPLVEDTRNRLRAHRNYASKYPSFFPKQRKVGANHLDKFIVMRKDGRQSPQQRRYKMGGIGRARYLLHILEYGSSPHHQPNLGGGFMHPGAAPRPFMTPAYEHGKYNVVRDFQSLGTDWFRRRATQLGLRTTLR